MDALPPDMLRALGLNPLDYEIAQEKAASLGRAGRRLTAALEVLAAFDAAHTDGPALTDSLLAERRCLVAEAGEALWFLIVQREAIGLRRHGALYRFYEVPADVRLRMGPKGLGV